LRQARAPKFVAADTMDLWINTARGPLMEVIGAVDLLTLNESEARLLAGSHNLVKAAKTILGWGPKYVIVKKGEHGAMLFAPEGIFLVPAFPLEEVHDPTGAGDTFAGGFMGALAAGGNIDPASIRMAMAYGSVVASFGVEAFSLDRLTNLTRADIGRRLRAFKSLISLMPS
jgi:sugar/nucleoside kinase (ribokinase family)